MRKFAVTMVTMTIASGIMTASAIASPPPPQACPGELVSFAVESFGGRRAVAEVFFGDYARAVQDAQGFMEQFCGVGPD